MDDLKEGRNDCRYTAQHVRRFPVVTRHDERKELCVRPWTLHNYYAQTRRTTMHVLQHAIGLQGHEACARVPFGGRIYAATRHFVSYGCELYFL